MKMFFLKMAILAVPILLAIAAPKNSQHTRVLTPVLGNYPNASLPLSTDTTVTPDAPPTNTTRINVSTSTNFKGTLMASPVTGVVRITNAHPAGTYTVTVRAFDSGGASATKTFMLTVTTPVTCTPVSFGPATEYSAGGVLRTNSVAVGDFNGDGKQDLAVTGYRFCCGGGVVILLGDGLGHFGLGQVYGTGFADAVAVGDFNGDGNLDLVVANYDYSIEPNLFVFLGDGSGHFGAATGYTVGDLPGSIAVGDFNGDGNPDLAVTGGGVVSILLGDGTGHFAAATNVPVAGDPVKLGDFNGDGNQDLAVASGPNVSILLGDGTGHFGAATNFPVPSGASSVAVGDFNGDGNQDLAVTGGGAVSILLGDGAGHFSAAISSPVASNLFPVAVGDFDGDGNQDVATVNAVNLFVLLGDGTGRFSVPNSFPGNNPVAVAVGDFSGDGKQDLAVANYQPDTVSVLLRNCTLTPTTAVSRMTHGSSGNFDINLPLTGSPGVECRTMGVATNDYTIIVTFPNPVTVNGNPQAQVTLGTGCVGTAGACSGSVNISGNTVTVPLTNVSNAQTINVTLFQVNGGSNVVIPMGVLIGDVGANRAVNAGDVALTKSHLGQLLDATNFRADVNASGAINATDVSTTKANLGTGLP